MAAHTGTAKGDVTVVEPTRAQRALARRVAEAKATVPDLPLEAEVDLTAAPATGVALDVVLAAATARALRAVPEANASYRDGRFERYARVNVGLTVLTDDGFVVPTLFDADRRPLDELAAAAAELTERVHAQTITAAELSGATCTVSHLGAHGIDAYVPALQAPQAAAAGLGAVRDRPVVRDGALAVAPVATLTVACDARILYGATAAAFVNAVRDAMQAP